MKRPKTLKERLERSINRDDQSGCWLWTGSTNSGTRYGAFGFRGTRHLAHRASYEVFVGQIPEGLTLDHLCRNVSCVNPAHLEPVSHRENVLRGESPAARWARRTHCEKGHEFTPENTMRGYASWSEGARRCRKCHALREHDRYHRNKAT